MKVSLPELSVTRSASPVALTVMSYLSIDQTAAQENLPSPGGLSLNIPTASKFAVGCLAVGIGCEGSKMIAALKSAPWFSHLRQAAQGPLCGMGRKAAASVLSDVLGRMQGPHAVSVALPRRPGHAEVDAACTVGHTVRRRGAFAVVTVSQPSCAAFISLGEAFDCLVQGDGGLHHHWYPHRTVTEPAGGRPICYDLYDVCSLWAGRVGSFGAMIPTADALHVEVSAEIEALAEVDRLATAMAARLEEPERLCLVNVVAGAGSGATAVSFYDSPVIRQERAAVRRDSMENLG